MSEEIQRYELSGPDYALNVCDLVEDSEGQWIEFAALSARDARIRELEKQVATAKRDELRHCISWLNRCHSSVVSSLRAYEDEDDFESGKLEGYAKVIVFLRARLKELDADG